MFASRIIYRWPQLLQPRRYASIRGFDRAQRQGTARAGFFRGVYQRRRQHVIAGDRPDRSRTEEPVDWPDDRHCVHRDAYSDRPDGAHCFHVGHILDEDGNGERSEASAAPQGLRSATTRAHSISRQPGGCRSISRASHPTQTLSAVIHFQAQRYGVSSGARHTAPVVDAVAREVCPENVRGGGHQSHRAPA